MSHGTGSVYILRAPILVLWHPSHLAFSHVLGAEFWSKWILADVGVIQPAPSTILNTVRVILRLTKLNIELETGRVSIV
jgi:hypothetical protein